MKNYYKILGLNCNCSQNEIRKAYKKKALLFHPDKNNNDKICEKKFKEISAAYEILSNPIKKKEYDLTGNINNYQFSSPFEIFSKIFSSNNEDFESQIEELVNKPEISLYMRTFMNIPSNEKIQGKKIYEKVSNIIEDNNIPSKISCMLYNLRERLTKIYENSDTKEKNYSSKKNTKKDEKCFNDKTKCIQNLSSTENNYEEYPEKNQETSENINISNIEKKKFKPEPLIYNANITLEDIYLKKEKKMTIERERINKLTNESSKEHVELVIESWKDNIVYYQQGHELINYLNIGDVIVNIIPKYHDDYIIYNKYNLIFKKRITLNHLSNGISFELNFIDETIFNIEIVDEIFLDKLYRIESKGLVKKNDKRGDLFIKFILVKNIQENELLTTTELNEKNVSLINIRLSNENSINEYSYIMNDENYKNFSDN